MDCIPPESAFLQELRGLCDQFGALLIFNEVMTAFRLGISGTQEYFNVRGRISLPLEKLSGETCLWAPFPHVKRLCLFSSVRLCLPRRTQRDILLSRYFMQYQLLRFHAFCVFYISSGERLSANSEG